MAGVTPSSRKRIIFGNDGIVTRTSSSQGFFPLKTTESKEQEAQLDPQVVEEYSMPSNLLATRSESPPPKAFQIKNHQHLRKNVVNHAHNQIVALEQDEDTILGERVSLQPY
jgi:hypothetical protein